MTPGHGPYRCCDGIFEDTRDHMLMHGLEHQLMLSVNSSIEVIGLGACGSSVEQVIFQIPLHLRVMEMWAFERGVLRFVTFPSSLLVIGRNAFDEGGIEEVRFEQDSKLPRSISWFIVEAHVYSTDSHAYWKVCVWWMLAGIDCAGKEG
jgi:hypothetical protein